MREDERRRGRRRDRRTNSKRRTESKRIRMETKRWWVCLCVRVCFNNVRSVFTYARHRELQWTRSPLLKMYKSLTAQRQKPSCNHANIHWLHVIGWMALVVPSLVSLFLKTIRPAVAEWTRLNLNSTMFSSDSSLVSRGVSVHQTPLIWIE